MTQMCNNDEDTVKMSAPLVHSGLTLAVVLRQWTSQGYFSKAGSAGLVKLFSASCVMKALHTQFHHTHGNSQEFKVQEL